LIGLLIAIVTFNLLAIKNNRLTPNQTLHIWSFTIAFQMVFDTIIEFKFHGYWYFSKDVDWLGLLPHIILIPPVNVLFLSFFPFKGKLNKKINYILIWTISILIYESITLLPEPWGYFHSGWWKLWHSAAVDPLLFLSLLAYFKLVRKQEEKTIS
jgi:hypothetical protein